MTQQLNYNNIIHQSLPLINTWLHNQHIEEIHINELTQFLQQIQLQTKEYSQETFEDIRYLLQPFEECLPLKIKRIFNLSTMDYYTMFITSRFFESIDDHINLIQTTRRFQRNMEKFHYNPVSLNTITREFFPYLQTLFIYSEDDELFEEDKRIIARNIQIVPYYLKYQEKEQLEQWIGLKCSEIFFDSNKDNWSISSSVFNDKIKGKKQLTFLIEDEDGELFGYYYNSQIPNEIEEYYVSIGTDFNSFQFNLKSKNNRLSQPMKFPILNTQIGGICFQENDDECLFQMGDINLMKYEKKEFSGSDYIGLFDYSGIRNALTGKEATVLWGQMIFIPKRFVVIQMK